MTNQPGLSLKGHIDSCFTVLGAFKRCLRSQQWDRLAERNAAIDQQMQRLASCLAEQPADDESLNRIRNLEVEVRRLKRQLAQQMRAVQEDIATVDVGIRKLQRSADALKAA